MPRRLAQPFGLTASRLRQVHGNPGPRNASPRGGDPRRSQGGAGVKAGCSVSAKLRGPPEVKGLARGVDHHPAKGRAAHGIEGAGDGPLSLLRLEYPVLYIRSIVKLVGGHGWSVM